MSAYLGPRVSLTVRIPESLRKEIAEEAKKRGLSINELMNLFIKLELTIGAPVQAKKEMSHPQRQQGEKNGKRNKD